MGKGFKISCEQFTHLLLSVLYLQNLLRQKFSDLIFLLLAQIHFSTVLSLIPIDSYQASYN